VTETTAFRAVLASLFARKGTTSAAIPAMSSMFHRSVAKPVVRTKRVARNSHPALVSAGNGHNSRKNMIQTEAASTEILGLRELTPVLAQQACYTPI
jgi:hypothetical protein